MGDLGAGATIPADDATVAFAVARDLLERAEADARRTLIEAERFAHQREQEAEQLLAKARRVLLAAEDKAAVILAVARAQAADGRIDLTVWDDELGQVVAPGATRLARGGQTARLDGMLAAAIAHAVDDAFPLDASA